MITKGAILVVNDTPANFDLLVEKLRADGYQMLSAKSGELALAAVAAQRPEMILLDPRTPGHDASEPRQPIEGQGDRLEDIPQGGDRFRLIMENLKDLVAVLDLKGRRLFNSSSYREILGDPADLQGSSSFDEIHPEDRERVKAAFHETVRTGIGQRLEYRLVARAGQVRYIESQGSVIRDDHGEISKVLVVSRDVTDRKEAQTRLGCFSRLGALLSAATSQQQAAQIMADAASDLLGWDACYLTLGAPDSAVLSLLIDVDTINGQRVVLPRSEAASRPTPMFRRVLTEGAQLILRQRPEEADPELEPTGDITRRALSLMFVPIRREGKSIGAFSVQSYRVGAYGASDVETLQLVADHGAGALVRLQAEEELRRNHDLYRRAIIAADAIPYQRDYVGDTYQFMGEGIKAITGYAPSELRRAVWKEMILETVFLGDATGLSVAEAGRRAVAGKLKNWRADHRIRTRSGEIRWISDSSIPLLDADGKYVGSMGILQDITERKKAEEEIRAQAELLDLAQDAISVGDMNGCVRFWNKGCERLFGWTAGEMLGKAMREVVKSRTGVFERAKRALLSDGHWSGEQTVLTKDGRTVTVMSRWSLVRDERGQPKSVLAISTDITEQKKLEAQFLRAQRVESVGRLAGGIAHDLNNILSPILMGTALLREGLPPDQAGPLLDIISGSAQRGADIVKQLLTFARGTEGQKFPIPPSLLIAEMAKLVQETFPKSLTLKTEVPKDLWTVMGDPTQLHQILLNLCVNARDAMPEGGTLTLSAENLTLDDCYAGMNPEAKAGPYVLLQVCDTGTGIPPEIIDKVFDPFFTTKTLDRGTGLGLATVQGIVKSHYGFIHLESQVGHGSRFKVYLPAHPKTEGPSVVIPEGELPRGHGESMLVVDDEPSVRDITARILEKHGYQVFSASDGTAAITLFAQHQSEIRLVLTDLMMPIMDGIATIRVLREINPQVKVIAASGAASKTRLAQMAELSVQGYLQKPFTARKLLVAVQQVLRGETTRWEPGAE